METIYLNPENLAYWQQEAKTSVMALGFFDGIHKGHREVIQTAYQKAKEKKLLLSVMTFFPHPKTVLSNGKTRIDYLMPLPDKEKIFSELGVDIFYIVEFDKQFSSLSPERFVAKYLLDLGVVYAVAGFDYTYGFRGEGNMDRLNSDSGGRIEVTKVEKVECRGEKISSTGIREKLSKGNVDDLPAFLGRSYEISCEWDGQSLKVNPYYTVPAPGQYQVTIKSQFHSQVKRIIVTENKELIPQQCDLGAGKVTIIWHQQVQDKERYTFYDDHENYFSRQAFIYSG